MREALMALGLFLLLAVASALLRSDSWGFLYYAGGFLIVAGLVFSLPCAILYHYRLHGSLAPRAALDPRWIWNPTGHHARLTSAERRRVMPWFYAGAAGWGATVLGCVLIGLASWRS